MSQRPGETKGSGGDPGERNGRDDADQRSSPDNTALLIENAVPVLRRWAHGRLPSYARSEGNTEDVVQDAVVRGLTRFPRFTQRTAAGIQAYLRISVINRIRDLIRRTKRRGSSTLLVDDLIADQPSPLEAAIRQERLERFLMGMQQLSPHDRQLIVWRITLGYSVAEMAARLGKSQPATGMAVLRAVQRLARHLGIDGK